MNKEEVKKLLEIFDYLNDNVQLNCISFFYNSMNKGKMEVKTTDGDKLEYTK